MQVTYSVHGSSVHWNFFDRPVVGGDLCGGELPQTCCSLPSQAGSRFGYFFPPYAIIPPMIASEPSRRALAAVLLLAGLVLAGRMALAVHPYEHDLAEFSVECDLCECCQVNGDDLHKTATASNEAPATEQVLPAVSGPELPFRRGPCLPRAPPPNLV